MAIAYYIEFFTIPIMALIMAIQSPPISVVALSSYVVGYLLWVMVEYWMHRHLFHVVFKRAHNVHHKRPLDAEGAPPTGLTHALLALFCISSISSLGWLVGPAFASGFLLGYVSYIVAHHVIHAGLLPNKGFVKRHELHHRGWHVNFNVLCPLGDLLFGTYKAR